VGYRKRNIYLWKEKNSSSTISNEHIERDIVVLEENARTSY
jgi:hypothetical protein